MSVFVPLDAREVHPVTSHGSTIAVHLTPGDVGILLPGTLHAGGVNKSAGDTLLFFYVDTIHTDTHDLSVGKQSVSNIPTPDPYSSFTGPSDYALDLLYRGGITGVTDGIKSVFRLK